MRLDGVLRAGGEPPLEVQPLRAEEIVRLWGVPEEIARAVVEERPLEVLDPRPRSVVADQDEGPGELVVLS